RGSRVGSWAHLTQPSVAVIPRGTRPARPVTPLRSPSSGSPTLPLVTQPGGPTTSIDLSGAWRVHTSDGDLARRFTDSSIPDGDWPELAVPGHWQSSDAFADVDGPLLYRRTYEPAPLAPGHRRFVSFDGIFYYGDIWLDGGYLGVTE